jgi:glycosyltransferase involved in cell wall biosynthesis
MKNDIVCFSHLRWNFVYQRPQHLIGRFARESRVLFVEEPIFDADTDTVVMLPDPQTGVFTVVPHLQKNLTEAETIARMKSQVDKVLRTMDVRNFVCWYYSPMALGYTDHLEPALIVYDCMDELSGFRFAHPEIVRMEKALLKKADLVFTGGHNLYNAKKSMHGNIHSFPSSIDKKHFLQARKTKKDPADQLNMPHPRFGFYGVVDERFDVDLLAEMVKKRPDWHFVILGPVVKIDPAILPRSENIHYLGSKTYEELPLYLGGWDIAIMPFAMNESTRYISPTKTPEYLCGGRPVISTPIVDVVNDYGRHGLVEIADTADAFIKAGEALLAMKDRKSWLKKVDRHLKTNSWDITWSKMKTLMEDQLKLKSTAPEVALRSPQGRMAPGAADRITSPFENPLATLKVAPHV